MHQRVSVNSICFMGTSLEQQAAYWRSLQAGRVSLLGDQIFDEGTSRAGEVLEREGCGLETIVLPLLPGRSLPSDRSLWEAPRTRLSSQIEAAHSLGARSIYMTTGGHGGMTWEQAAETFAEIIAPCVSLARSAGIALMIENAPPPYADIHIAHTLRDAVALAELADIGVCIDLVGCWTEAGLHTSIERAVARCSLVQVSDYVCGDRCVPARAVPGDGDVPLERLFGWILDAGYQGCFDLELLGPRIEEEGPLEAVRRAAHAVGKLLQSLDTRKPAS
jgi:sugar phosphate isomerase/epimerase